MKLKSALSAFWGIRKKPKKKPSSKDLSESHPEDKIMLDEYLPKDGIMYISFMSENVENAGEDATPVVQFLDEVGSLGVIGVFDGMGGAGSSIYTHRQGYQRSAAFFASFYITHAIKKHFNSTIRQYQNQSQPLRLEGNRLATALKDTINDQFRQALNDLEIPPSKIRGKSIRKLPTTAALIYFQKAGSSTPNTTKPPAYSYEAGSSDVTPPPPPMPVKWGYRYIAVWAGDSRCYTLSPEKGLQQLSVDDLVQPQDALDNILEDSPMSNFVHGEEDYDLHTKEFRTNKPEILLVATDGCFSYLLSPMHFEFFLIETLVHAKSLEDWKNQLQHLFAEHAADDTSLALVVLGFGDASDENFKQLQGAFGRRFNQLQRQYINEFKRHLSKIESLERNIKNLQADLTVAQTEFEEARRSLWLDYKKGYEVNPTNPDDRFKPPRKEEGSS